MLTCLIIAPTAREQIRRGNDSKSGSNSGDAMRQRNSTSADMIAAVRHLVRIAHDDLIAGLLNRNRLMTGHGNRWTRERVTALRSHHRIPVYRPAPDGIELWLNLTQAAAHLGVS